MTGPADRRFGNNFIGGRPVLQLGDPGIDAGWFRRYRWAAIGFALWFALVPVGFGIGFLSAWGPFGLIDRWQLDTFGSGNVILLVILFMPLSFVPLILAHLLPTSTATPVLIGIRQSFDPKWGPKIMAGPLDPRARLRRSARVAQGVAAIGAAVFAFFAIKGFHDADTPHAPLSSASYERLADARVPLPYAVRLVGAVADRTHSWVYRYRVRQDRHRDVYYPLRPVAGRSVGPARIVEVDRTDPDQDDRAPWNAIDPPGAREGRVALLDDWTAGELRRAGIALAPRVVLLAREQLHGRDPRPDPIDDFVFGVFAFATTLVALLAWWGAKRGERLLPEDTGVRNASRPVSRRPSR